MLDNSHLSSFAKTALKFMPYETKIETFDNNCLKCPSHFIAVKKGDFIIKAKTLSEAIDSCLVDNKASIVRGCNEDGGHSLSEITANTCSMWYEPKGHNDDKCSFEEVDEIQFGTFL